MCISSFLSNGFIMSERKADLLLLMNVLSKQRLSNGVRTSTE